MPENVTSGSPLPAAVDAADANSFATDKAISNKLFYGSALDAVAAYVAADYVLEDNVVKKLFVVAAVDADKAPAFLLASAFA